jgi:hypothetical protein
VEQCTRDPAGDSQQLPLPCEYPDGGGFTKFWQVDCAAVSNPGRTFRRSNHGGKFRQYQPGMKKKLVKHLARLGLIQLFQAVGFVNCEFAHSRPFERGKMSSASQFLSQIMR